MADLRSIRERLGVTQQVLADGIGKSQGNVSFYEKGQEVPPDVARRLIDFARTRGLVLTYEHIYDGADLPAEPAKAES